jgi:hypothetical protein
MGYSKVSMQQELINHAVVEHEERKVVLPRPPYQYLLLPYGRFGRREFESHVIVVPLDSAVAVLSEALGDGVLVCTIPCP